MIRLVVAKGIFRGEPWRQVNMQFFFAFYISMDAQEHIKAKFSLLRLWKFFTAILSTRF